MASWGHAWAQNGHAWTPGVMHGLMNGPCGNTAFLPKLTRDMIVWALDAVEKPKVLTPLGVAISDMCRCMTGLDTKSSKEVIAMLQSLNDVDGKTLVIVTHDPEVADAAKRIVAFRDGLIVEDRKINQNKYASIEAGT